MSQIQSQQIAVTQFAVFSAVVAALEDNCKGLKVTNQDEKNRALAFGSQVKQVRSQVEAIRTELKRPVIDFGREVDVAARSADTPLAELESRIKAALVEFDRAQEAERRKQLEELRKREAELAAKAQRELEAARVMAEEPADQAKVQSAVLADASAAQLAIRAEARAVKSQGVSGVRKRWMFEVTDADQVPREYLTVDETKLRAAVTTFGKRSIPGVRIFEETTVALGRGR